MQDDITTSGPSGGKFALISPPIYYELLYMRFPGLYASIGSAAVVHLVSLIVPTTLMGMSLPFLVHAAVRDTGGAFRDISYLYGINVVGAGIGVLLAPWLLIRTFGIDGAVRLSAAGNILVGLTALWIRRGLSSRKAESGQRVQASIPVNHHAEPKHGSGRRFGLRLALYTLSGLTVDPDPVTDRRRDARHGRYLRVQNGRHAAHRHVLDQRGELDSTAESVGRLARSI